MNMLMFFWLILIRNVKSLTDNCRNKIFMKISYTSKLLDPHIKVIGSVSSAQHCLEQCRDCVGCKSVGIDTSSMTCYLYNGRVYAGLPGTANSNMVYYWELEDECPLHLGYTEDPSSKICTRFNSTQLNWLDAQAACEEDGGHLILVDTPEKLFLVNSYVTDGVQILAGATNVGDIGVWNWLNGKPVNRSHYIYGEPNNFFNIEYCLAVEKRYKIQIGFNDVSCDYKPASFICEISTSALYPS